VINDLLQELSVLVEKDNDGVPSNNQNTQAAAPKEKIDNLSFIRGLNYDKNKTLNQRDAADLLAQAQEKAEEVDTIAFGLELNDGEIVKVYVNVDDAEAFEKAMSELLGKEDDVEAAINDLSTEFDIVSVEWPEDREEGFGSSEDEEVPANEEPPENPEKENKVKLAFNLNEPDEEKTEGGEEEEGADKEGSTEEEEDGLGSLGGFGDTGSEEEAKDAATGGEEEEDTGSEEEASDKKEKAPSKKKKKKAPDAKKKKEDTSLKGLLGDSIEADRLWPYSSFFEYLEEKENKKDDPNLSKEEEKIEDLFKTVLQRKIIKLILLLGIPASRLAPFKTKLRHGIREAALNLSNNTKGRLFANRAIAELIMIADDQNTKKQEKELASAKEDKEDVKEAISNSLSANTMFDHLLELFASLGVPHDALHTRKTALRQALRPSIAHILKHSKLRTNLGQLGKALGHAHHASKDTEEEPVNEQIDEELKLGADPYVQLVASLALALGIPEENLNYRKTGLVAALRTKKETLNLATVKAKAVALARVLNPVQNTNEELMFEDAYRQRSKAIDMGQWSITRTGERVRLSVNDFEIKLDSSETKRLMHAVDNGFETTVRAGEQHYNFKPIDHGREYAVHAIDSEDHDELILLPKRSVEALIELF
jgi:hypothetical protein